jgi:hypothetical protein
MTDMSSSNREEDNNLRQSISTDLVKGGSCAVTIKQFCYYEIKSSPSCYVHRCVSILCAEEAWSKSKRHDEAEESWSKRREAWSNCKRLDEAGEA